MWPPHKLNQNLSTLKGSSAEGGNEESKAFTTPLTKCRSPKGDEGLGGVGWVGQSSQGGFAEGPYQDTKATHLGNSPLSTKHL